MNPSKENSQLLKLLGVGFGIAVTVGGTIGTGILRKPGVIAEFIPNYTMALLLWAAIGLYSLLGALCAIELAISMPQAGAWYVYARKAFGNYFGFVTGITSWLGTVAAIGFGAYTLSEYLGLLIPACIGYERYLAIAMLIVITSFHMIGSKTGGKSQEILAIIKAVGLLFFVVICFYYGGNLNSEISTTDLVKVNTHIGFLAIISAMQAIFYTYDGWHTAAYFTEENTDPAKTLPKSMITGVLLVTVIYLLVNAAIMYVIPPDQLVGSKLAAADAIQMIFGAGVGKVVTIFLLISILGICNAQVMFAPRVIYSMGRDNLFFKSVLSVNKGGSPVFALAITSAMSSLLIISGKNTCAILSDIATFFFVMSYCAGFAALIRLRYSFPEMNRPYKAPFFPYLPLLLLVVSLIFLVGAVYNDIESSKFALIFLVCSYPLYKMVQKMYSKAS